MDGCFKFGCKRINRNRCCEEKLKEQQEGGTVTVQTHNTKEHMKKENETSVFTFLGVLMRHMMQKRVKTLFILNTFGVQSYLGDS